MTSPHLFVSGTIMPTLNTMAERAAVRYDGLAAVKLLAMIAAHESHFRHRRQLGGGPARGLYQIEPETLDDLYTNYLSYRPDAQTMVDSFQDGGDRYGEIENNDAFATCIARMLLWRAPKALPTAEDTAALAAYAKTHWNTRAGAATSAKYLADFEQYFPDRAFWAGLATD